MILAHRWLCSSQIWRTLVRTQLAPWALDGVTLGDKVLEVGPGPGLTTECLRPLITDLTCIDINAAYASSLARRMAGQNVRVLAGDAARMPLAAANFDA